MSRKFAYDVGVFIFRRDLRLDDNLGLIRMTRECASIVPIFCLDQNQIVETDKNKHYRSESAVQFMCESLADLNLQLNERSSKLFMFYGLPWEILGGVLSELKKSHKSVAAGWNHDYSEYSQKRDAEMISVCGKLDVKTLVNTYEYTLRPMEEYQKGSGGGFKQFTAFWRTAAAVKPNAPEKCEGSFYSKNSTFSHEFNEKLSKFYTHNPKNSQKGGRSIALDKLSKIAKHRDYNEKRDFLTYESTQISAAMNFGCVSVREVYDRFRKDLNSDTDLIKQLYWRDYFLAIGYYLPHALSFKRMIDSRFDQIKFKPNHDEWTKLMECKTGFLLVDAAMTQMITTGYISNRARMLLGMMWTKYLLTHVYDEKYGLQAGYSKYFVDAIGPVQNKLNCAWIYELDFAGRRYAAPGAPLSGRPMDISNKQIKKWDADCKYIKTWLPHLKNVPVDALIDWNEQISKKFKNIHPAPMFDAKERLAEFVELCRGL